MLTPSLSSPKEWPVFKIGSYSFSLLVVTVLAAAIALVVMSFYENIRFARGTDQIINLVAGARSAGIQDQNFAQRPGEDLIDALRREGQLAGSEGQPLDNPWQGNMRIRTVKPSIIRIETDVPVNECRRLALFFAKAARDLGLQSMEAREGTGIWRLFYDLSQSRVSSRAVEAACGQEPQAELALVLRIK